VRVSVNGEQQEIEAGATVVSLLATLGLTGRRVAVELNRRVVVRSAWPETELRENDVVEIVQFVGGG
jgi:sulfur carrier protein